MTASPAISATRSAGEEFKVDCTKFDKLLLVFRDGHYQVDRAAGKIICRSGCCALRSAGTGTCLYSRLYQSRSHLPEALHLWRDHPEQDLPLHSPQIQGPVLRSRTRRRSSTSSTSPRRTRRSINKPAPPPRSRSKALKPAAAKSRSRMFLRSIANPRAAGIPKRLPPSCNLCSLPPRIGCRLQVENSSAVALNLWGNDKWPILNLQPAISAEYRPAGLRH